MIMGYRTEKEDEVLFIKIVIIVLTPIVIFISFFACMHTGYDYFIKEHGKPHYKVSLVNIQGVVVETKLFHEKFESSDWGQNRNYHFTRFYFIPSSHCKEGGGEIKREDWEWPKTNVIIECIKND